MIYKDKIASLLEQQDSKLRILESVAIGTMRLNQNDVIKVIEDCKRLKESISELISLER
jgi:hypothetical protein